MNVSVRPFWKPTLSDSPESVSALTPHPHKADKPMNSSGTSTARESATPSLPADGKSVEPNWQCQVRGCGCYRHGRESCLDQIVPLERSAGVTDIQRPTTNKLNIPQASSFWGMSTAELGNDVNKQSGEDRGFAASTNYLSASTSIHGTLPEHGSELHTRSVETRHMGLHRSFDDLEVPHPPRIPLRHPIVRKDGDDKMLIAKLSVDDTLSNEATVANELGQALEAQMIALETEKVASVSSLGNSGVPSLAVKPNEGDERTDSIRMQLEQVTGAAVSEGVCNGRVLLETCDDSLMLDANDPRERNRAAVRKCRQKAADRRASLQAEAQQLEEENARMRDVLRHVKEMMNLQYQ